jgi:membrane-associated protease RseP (regulator of RpoE activity)
MRNSLWMVAIVTVGSFASGCAHTSLYQSWGKQLTEMPRHNGRVDDVSMLLGAAPTRCEPVASPRPLIGIGFDSEKPVVTSVIPNSPAYQAGIRPGDSILSISNQSVADSAQIRATIQGIVRDGEPLNIETSRGALVVVPKVPKAEQCYWEIQAGPIARSSEGAYVNPWGGGASSRGAAYQRFFRASCRVHDDFIAECQANWQK